jgi:hypothetical protein
MGGKGEARRHARTDEISRPLFVAVIANCDHRFRDSTASYNFRARRRAWTWSGSPKLSTITEDRRVLSTVNPAQGRPVEGSGQHRQTTGAITQTLNVCSGVRLTKNGLRCAVCGRDYACRDDRRPVEFLEQEGAVTGMRLPPRDGSRPFSHKIFEVKPRRGRIEIGWPAHNADGGKFRLRFPG